MICVSEVIRRNLRLLVAVQALYILAIQISFVSVPIITYLLSNSAVLAGIAVAIIWIGRAAMVYKSGRLMDRYGRRPVFLLGALLMLLGFLVISYSTLA